MMRKTNEARSPAGILLPAVAAGMLTTLLLMLVGAVLMYRGMLPEYAVASCALVFLAVGSLLGGLCAAKRAAGRKLIWAMGAGLAVFLILLLIGVLMQLQPVNPVRTAASLLCALAASALGGLVGVNVRKKKRYSHVKK
nr:TIGR04086 family membrane protein [uncultured Agathobaculum sp.]